MLIYLSYSLSDTEYSHPRAVNPETRFWIGSSCNFARALSTFKDGSFIGTWRNQWVRGSENMAFIHHECCLSSALHVGVWLRVDWGELLRGAFCLSWWHPGLLLWVQLNLCQRKAKKCNLSNAWSTSIKRKWKQLMFWTVLPSLSPPPAANEW